METYSEGVHAQLPLPKSNTLSRWFLPRRAVLHQHKPEKLRIVFVSSAFLGGISLTD